MADTLLNLNRDASTFRGSASEAVVQRIETAMVKLDRVQEKAKVWDKAFDNAYHGARIFHDQLSTELTNLRNYADGTIFNPHNFIIKALNGSKVESTFNATQPTYESTSDGSGSMSGPRTRTRP